MKTLITLFITIFIGSISTAQEIPENEDQENKELRAFQGRIVSQIEKTNIPYNIYRNLSQGEFKKWEIIEAFFITDRNEFNEGKSSYIIVVKKREERIALYYNEEGRLIRQERIDFPESSHHFSQNEINFQI